MICEITYYLKSTVYPLISELPEGFRKDITTCYEVAIECCTDSKTLKDIPEIYGKKLERTIEKLKKREDVKKCELCMRILVEIEYALTTLTYYLTDF